MVDLDEVFAYSSQKKVKILDRKLGFLFYGTQIAVLIYIGLFVFLLNKAYLGYEWSVGQVRVELRGAATFSTESGSKVILDDHDLMIPEMENGAVFIITGIEAVKQSRGSCDNDDFDCSSDSDCPRFPGVSQQKCGSAGKCTMAGWCPPVSSSETKKYVLDVMNSNVSVWFRTSIQFPVLAKNQSFTSFDNNVPVFDEDESELETDAWRLQDFLLSCGVKLQNIVETGAVIIARLEWNCDLETMQGCRFPDIHTKRLDSGSGFSYDYPKYLKSSSMDISQDVRLLFRYSGIRILIVPEGHAFGFSLQQTMLQLSSALALLSVAAIITDFLMMAILPERRHYTNYKQVDTPDFSDVRDLLASTANRSKVTV